MYAISRRKMYFLCWIVSLCQAISALAESGFFEVNVPPKETDNFYEARARLWIPNNASKIKINAVLVLLNGTDSDARSSVSKPEWQALAREHNLALLGCYFRGDGEPYENAAGGSGEALLRMLRIVADESRLPGLSDSPLLIIGHSAGAMFAYNFTCWRPETVLAFVSLKSGPILPAKNLKATGVPGLFIVGESDLVSRVRSTATAYLKTPGEERFWAFALEPQGGHGSSDAIRFLIRTYLEDILSLAKDKFLPGRIRNPKSRGVVRQLRDPSQLSKFTYSSVKEEAWLPGSASDSAWQKFVQAVRITEFAKDGGKEDSRSNVSSLTLKFGKLDLRDQKESFKKSFVLNDPILQGSSFLSRDNRLSVVEVKELGPGKYILTLQILVDQLGPGFFRSSVNAISPSKGNASIPVSGQLVANYSATPSSLYVGVIPRDQVSEMQIALNYDDGKPLEVSSIRSSRPGFASARQIENGKLLCRFDGGQGLGNQSGHFDVTLVGSPKRKLKIVFIAWVSKRTTKSMKIK